MAKERKTMLERNQEIPLHLRIVNPEGTSISQYNGFQAWQTLKDKPVEAMLEQVFPDLPSWFDYSAIGKVNEEAVAILMEDVNSAPIGFVHARQEGLINGPEGKEKWVFSILAAAKQGGGIGGKLIETLKEDIASYGGKYLFARTDPTRTATIGFYLNHGFQIDGMVGHYYYGPAAAVWMWCPLEGEK